MRALGLPARSELDGLYAQVKDLRRELAELMQSRGATAASGGAAPGSAGAQRGAKPKRAPQVRPRAGRRARGPKR